MVFIDVVAGWRGSVNVYKLCRIASRSNILTADWLSVIPFVQSQSRIGCARLTAAMAEDGGRIPRMLR